MSTRHRALSRLAGAAAVLLVGAGAGLGLFAAPAAHANACGGASGVTVVVDFGELGRGVTAGCDPDTEGQRARAILVDAGYPLTMATKSPGFVCRVSGLPSDDPCVEAAPPDRYWSIWWADGQGGSWVYSSRGVDTLRVPDGGYVAMAWHQGDGKAQPPATVPVARTGTSTQTPPPTSKPGPKQGGGVEKGQSKPQPSDDSSATGAPSTTASSEPSGDATATSSGDGTPSAEASPSDEPTPGETMAVDPSLPSAAEISLGPDDATPAAAESTDGLPAWVIPGVVIALVAAGAVVVVRRRQA